MFGCQNPTSRLKYGGNSNHSFYWHYLRTVQWLGNGNGVWWHNALRLCLEQRQNYR